MRASKSFNSYVYKYMLTVRTVPTPKMKQTESGSLCKVLFRFIDVVVQQSSSRDVIYNIVLIFYLIPQTAGCNIVFLRIFEIINMIDLILFDNPALAHINHFWTFSIALDA